MELNKIMLKGLMKMISPDQIDEAIKGITEFAIKEKENYPLDKFKGETEHAIMIYEMDSIPYFSIVILRDQGSEMAITRFVGTKPLVEMITDITKNI
jgi:hypothetical protein